MRRFLILPLLLLVSTSFIAASPRRTTIETIVETVTRRVVHTLLPQCQCSQVAACKKEAMVNVNDCFEECDEELEMFHSQSSLSLTECFSANMGTSIEADECLFKGIKNFCRSDGKKEYIRPGNFSEAVGFDLTMAPAADEIPDVPMFKRALEHFNVFEGFFGCTKRCIHAKLTACFANKRCAVNIPTRETLKPIYEKCHAHTPQMGLSLFNACQCLAYRKRVTSLYGMCPIISNPTFIDN